MAPIHPKAMPVILTTRAEVDLWLTAPVKDALAMQRPLPDGAPTFGYETARAVGAGVVENLLEDARTTGRWYVCVSMGRTSGALAVSGMVVTAIGLALMTTLQRDTGYAWPGIFMFIVGIGSGMFNSPNTAAMMGVVPAHRRGIASGARVLVQNTGAVLSIAFVMAVVTSGIKRNVLFSIFSGLGKRISSGQLDPFLSNMHFALWCMTGFSVIGAVVSFARPKYVAHQSEEVAAPPSVESAPTAAAAAAA